MIYLDDFVFPSLPERIAIDSGSNYQTYNLMNRKMAIPNGTTIKAVKWSGVFFGEFRQDTVLVQEWLEPEECIRFLNDAMLNGITMNLLVDEAPINLDVTVASLHYEAVGAFGDIEYTIELQEAAALKVYTISELNIQPHAKTIETRPNNTPETDQTYTVVKNDNLWKIARKFYGGSGGDWRKIYDANMAVIEESAKKHGKSSSDQGHWIYPGCQLKIP